MASRPWLGCWGCQPRAGVGGGRSGPLSAGCSCHPPLAAGGWQPCRHARAGSRSIGCVDPVPVGPGGVELHTPLTAGGNASADPRTRDWGYAPCSPAGGCEVELARRDPTPAGAAHPGPHGGRAHAAVLYDAPATGAMRRPRRRKGGSMRGWILAVVDPAAAGARDRDVHRHRRQTGVVDGRGQRLVNQSGGITFGSSC